VLVNIIKFCSMFSPLVGKRRLAGTGCCGLKSSIYAENLPDEARKANCKKLKYNHKGLMDPYELTSGWLCDPSVYPDLPFGDIAT
jgi:hypothetical protein